MSKVIGVTVGTPTSPKAMAEKIKPVTSINGMTPDEDGDVQLGGGAAIIDVAELPTEGINEEAFYRVPTLTAYWGINDDSETYTIHAVESLPEVGEPITTDMESFVYYYNMADNDAYGYAPDEIANQYGLPGGWYPASMLFQIVGATFDGIIYSTGELADDTIFRFLLTYDIYSYKNVWRKEPGVGWKGTSYNSEIHNSETNIASGNCSFAAGYNTTASGNCSFATGENTTASGNCSFATGENTTANGSRSFAAGYNTTASGDYSSSEGFYTYAIGNCQHVQGKFNIGDYSNKYAHIVGNGTSKLYQSNAHTLDWDGNAWFAGDVYLGGANQDDSNAVKVKDAINQAKTAADNASAKASELEERLNSGEFDGKSAYQYAQDGGYTGTEAEFAQLLSIDPREYIVTVQGDMENGYTSDKSYADILAAYESGRTVNCLFYGEIVSGGLTPLFNVSDGMLVFLGALSATAYWLIAIVDGFVQANEVSTSITIGGQEWIGEEPVDFTDTINEMISSKIPTALKNPKKITFTGAATGSYDGSSAMTINIPTTETVVNAVLAALPTWNGGSY